MRAVVTRVKNARVEIDGKVNGKTDGGFLVLLGVAADDTQGQADSATRWPTRSAVFAFSRMRTRR